MQTDSKKIVIIEDQALFANGFKEILCKIEGVEVLKIIEDTVKTSDILSLNKADLIFLDLNLKGQNGFDVLKEIRKSNQELRVVILTMYVEEVLVKKAKETGANAFLTKDATLEELKKVIFLEDEKTFYISENIRKKNKVHSFFAEDNFSSSVLITNREKEILRCIVKGNTSKEIAKDLNISSSTVDTHRKNMQRKLKIHKISELVNYAIKNFNF